MLTIKRTITYGVIVGAAVLCYANGLNNPFIWDQEVFIAANPLIRSWNNLPLVFKTSAEGKLITAHGFYRPLEVISYMLDYSIWGLNPFGYRLTCLILHILNALLIFLLLNRITLKRSIAFLTALVFCIHPVNTVTVTYTVRGDLLAAFFSLLTVFFFLDYHKGKKPAGFLAVFTYILALLSKEWAVVAPFIIFLYTSLHYKKKTSPLGIILILLSLFYVFIRVKFIFGAATGPLSLIAKAPLSHRFLTLPKILLTYLGLTLLPIHLHMEYLFVVKSPAHLSFLLGLPALFAIGVWFLLYIKRIEKRDPGLKNNLLFFLGWFLLGLAPFCNIAIPLHATVAENWLYFPGIGFLGFIILLFHRLSDKISGMSRHFIVLMLITLLLYYAGATVNRNYQWKDPLKLYLHDVKYAPDSFILHNNIGVEYFRRGDIKKAKEAFLKAIEVSPGQGYDVAYNNIGVIYENEGRPDKAEESYKMSVELNNYELAFENLARLYLKQGRYDEALAVSIKGRKIYPLNSYFHVIASEVPEGDEAKQSQRLLRQPSASSQ